MAKFATGHRDEALDLVQESMLRFVRHYSVRPRQEWNALSTGFCETGLPTGIAELSYAEKSLPGWARKALVLSVCRGVWIEPGILNRSNASLPRTSAKKDFLPCLR
jgi:hypothetical protein